VFWTCLLEETSRTSPGTQSHAQWRLSDGQDRRAAPTRILFEETSPSTAFVLFFFTLPRSPPLDGLLTPRLGLCEAGSAPVPAGSNFPLLADLFRVLAASEQVLIKVDCDHFPTSAAASARAVLSARPGGPHDSTSSGELLAT
jgi:hypothetical protein